MSPAAELLESLRIRRKLSQAVFSRLTGLPASYVSGLVSGKQHIPRHQRFIEQIAHGLALRESQISKLRTAVELSPRAFTIPPDADREIFLMVAALRDRMADIDGEFAYRLRKQIENYRPRS